MRIGTTMITDVDREKYRDEYEALRIRPAHRLWGVFHHEFKPNQDCFIGGGSAGKTYRFKVSTHCVALTAWTRGVVMKMYTCTVM